jgi:hypothetical protein
MNPGEARDLMFAGAGILWGVVTVFRGVQEWSHAKEKSSFPTIVAVGAALTLGCLSYLVCRL